jgi:hypothetical protein
MWGTFQAAFDSLTAPKCCKRLFTLKCLVLLLFVAVVDIRSPNSKKNLPEGCWWFDSATAAANLMSAVLQLQSVASAAAGAAVETPAKAGAAAGSCFSTQSGMRMLSASSSSLGRYELTDASVSNPRMANGRWVSPGDLQLSHILLARMTDDPEPG